MRQHMKVLGYERDNLCEPNKCLKQPTADKSLDGLTPATLLC